MLRALTAGSHCGGLSLRALALPLVVATAATRGKRNVCYAGSDGLQALSGTEVDVEVVPEAGLEPARP